MAPIPFIGPFPPPVHGQAVATAKIATLLEKRGIVLRRFDTGEAGATGRWYGRAHRIAGMMLAALYCVLPGAPAVYLSVSANAGMIFTAMLAGLARLSGKRPILHHHTYAHVVARNGNMTFLAGLAGPNAVHVTICPAMSRELAATYPEVKATATFSNVDAVDGTLLAIGRERATPATLGIMGNLTFEKGVERAIAAFRLARAHGLVDSLILAGPCQDDSARAAIAAAKTEFGERLRYLGPVAGDSKFSFFADIDVFLFPSLYRNETQGIVNLEALAAGVPVIAYGLCCIPSDLNDPSCAVVSPNAAFDAALIPFLEYLTTRLPAASASARARFEVLARAHEAEIDALAFLLTPAAKSARESPCAS